MITFVEKGIRSLGGAQNIQLVALLFVSSRSSEAVVPFLLHSSFLPPPHPPTLVLELEIQGHVIYLRSTQGGRENKD